MFAAHSYELDVLGRRTKQTFANGLYDAYRYDATGQVVGADYALRPNGNAGQSSRTQQFNYDAMGNRLSFIDSGVETRYTPNNVNQYTDVSVATSPPDGGWRYDARGNLRRDGSRRFRWDGEDRLTRADVPNAAEGKQRVDYTYDSKSRRVIRKQGREHTLYIYDQWNCIAEKRGLSVSDEARRVRFSMPRESNQYTVDGRNSDSLLATRYVWGTDISNRLQGAGGVGGLLHADEVTNGRGKTKGYYFHYDGNGNVKAIANAKGRRAASYTYDAFGNTLEAKGNYADQNSYRFSTKPLDEVTGFYYYGYRYYDPVTGRWPSRDLIEERGGVNVYSMGTNSLIWKIDILGLEVLKFSAKTAIETTNYLDAPWDAVPHFALGEKTYHEFEVDSETGAVSNENHRTGTTLGVEGASSLQQGVEMTENDLFRVITIEMIGSAKNGLNPFLGNIDYKVDLVITICVCSGELLSETMITRIDGYPTYWIYGPNTSFGHREGDVEELDGDADDVTRVDSFQIQGVHGCV